MSQRYKKWLGSNVMSDHFLLKAKFTQNISKMEKKIDEDILKTTAEVY